MLKDENARQHLLEFLEDQDAAHFLRFWLDANSFRAVTETRLNSGLLMATASSGSGRVVNIADLGIDKTTNVTTVSLDYEESPDSTLNPIRSVLESDTTRHIPKQCDNSNSHGGCPDMERTAAAACAREAVVQKLHKSKLVILYDAILKKKYRSDSQNSDEYEEASSGIIHWLFQYSFIKTCDFAAHGLRTIGVAEMYFIIQNIIVKHIFKNIIHH